MPNYLVENLFGIKGLNIAWYGAIISPGILAGVLLARHRAKLNGLQIDLLYDYLLIAVPIAVVGARAYYVLFRWDY